MKTSIKTKLYGLFAAAYFTAFTQIVPADTDDRRAELKRAFAEIDEQRKAEEDVVSKSNPMPPNWLDMSPEQTEKWRAAQAEVVKELDALARKWEKEDALNGHEWATTLDPLPEGGWTLITLAGDGRLAVFATRRQLMRKANFVLAWFRLEERSPNGQVSGTHRNEYDCSKFTVRAIAVNQYTKPNLQGVDAEKSFVVEPSELKWEPVSPGSIGEAMAEWACKHAPSGSR